jgi:hypothetical protein
MDPTLDYGALIQALFGSGPAAAQPMVPRPQIPVPPVPAPGMVAGPTAPIPAPQGFEMTNTGNPMPPRPAEPYMTDPMVTGAQPTTLGAALEPTIPLPRPRPAEAPAATTNPTAVNVKGMTDALKGVIAPPAPSSQKVGTPHPPAMGKLQGGNVAELLASLGIGPQQAFPGLKLPSTLGQALAGR